jgi:uncharacterized membrane protein YbjE (DUF340 family)
VTIVGRIIGAIVLCFLVGLFLSRLGITARGIITDTGATILSVFTLLGDLVGWAVPYVLLGAVIVVPLALLSLLHRYTRRR